MLRIGFFSAGTWPWQRQTPNNDGVWGECQFLINPDPAEAFDYAVVYESAGKDLRLTLSKDRCLFISGEPMNVKKYPEKFLAQFGRIITSDPSLNHSSAAVQQTGLPWHYGIQTATPERYSEALTYAQLLDHAPLKTKTLSVICSNKAFTPQHQRRLAFVSRLKELMGDDLDVFGRGFKDIADKAEVIAPYRYHIALENSDFADYWSEKIADPLLGRAFPFYAGCVNLEEYLPAESFIRISMDDTDSAAIIIKDAIKADVAAQRQAASAEARTLILEQHNIFAILSREIAMLEGLSLPREGKNLLRTEGQFLGAPIALRQRIRQKLEGYPLIFKIIYKAYRLYTSIQNDWEDAWIRYRPVLRDWRIHWQRMLTDPFYRSHQRWLKKHADEEIRHAYPLASESIVFDVGGFEGNWTAEMNKRYQPQIHVFEPIASFCTSMIERFKGQDNIHIHPYGLSDTETQATISLQSDASSTFAESARTNESTTIQLRDISAVMDELKINHIDLMKINIEGGEFPLLERLVTTGKIAQVKTLQVQFHTFVPNAKARYKALSAALSKTHKRTWHFPFVWENWQRKNSAEP